MNPYEEDYREDQSELEWLIENAPHHLEERHFINSGEQALIDELGEIPGPFRLALLARLTHCLTEIYGKPKSMADCVIVPDFEKPTPMYLEDEGLPF